jgi:hypothetical protein
MGLVVRRSAAPVWGVAKSWRIRASFGENATHPELVASGFERVSGRKSRGNAAIVRVRPALARELQRVAREQLPIPGRNRS